MFYTLLDYSAIREEIFFLRKAPEYAMSMRGKKGSCEKLEGIQLWTAVGLVLKQNLAGRWGGGPRRVVRSRKSTVLLLSPAVQSPSSNPLRDKRKLKSKSVRKLDESPSPLFKTLLSF